MYGILVFMFKFTTTLAKLPTDVRAAISRARAKSKGHGQKLTRLPANTVITFYDSRPGVGVAYERGTGDEMSLGGLYYDRHPTLEALFNANAVEVQS